MIQVQSQKSQTIPILIKKSQTITILIKKSQTITILIQKNQTIPTNTDPKKPNYVLSQDMLSPKTFSFWVAWCVRLCMYPVSYQNELKNAEKLYLQHCNDVTE